ncbi:MAG: nucleotide exchange factor GrpE [Bacilli bacterium]|nr:nucleotide exchange factor GrpE [Bacilli bacterium]
MQEETPSVEKEEIKEEEETGKRGKKISRDKYDALAAEAEKLKADRDHWKNEYYKAFADTQNLRKSLEAENREAIRYRASGFISELLPALDGFHMALQNDPPSQETKNYLVGFKYIYNQIQSVLESEGVKEICPKPGDAYDLDTMHAVDFTETLEVEEGKVTKIYAKGYKLHDRLIRAAMVSIAKPPKQEEAGDTKEESKEPSEENPKVHQA